MVLTVFSTLRTQEDIFIDALRAYQQTSKAPKVQSLNLEGTHNWNDVLRLVKDNQDIYEQARKRKWNRLGRFLERQAENLYPWLRLIPNDFTASIVSGGLKCIFEVGASKTTVHVLRADSTIGSHLCQAGPRRSPADAPTYSRYHPRGREQSRALRQGHCDW